MSALNYRMLLQGSHASYHMSYRNILMRSYTPRKSVPIVVSYRYYSGLVLFFRAAPKIRKHAAPFPKESFRCDVLYFSQS